MNIRNEVMDVELVIHKHNKELTLYQFTSILHFMQVTADAFYNCSYGP